MIIKKDWRNLRVPSDICESCAKQNQSFKKLKPYVNLCAIQSVIF